MKTLPYRHAFERIRMRGGEHGGDQDDRFEGPSESWTRPGRSRCRFAIPVSFSASTPAVDCVPVSARSPMLARTCCPFCSTINCDIVDASDPLPLLECQSCGKQWREDTGARPPSQAHTNPLPRIPRPTRANVPPRCGRCQTVDSIRIERRMAGSDMRDVFACSHCGGVWPVQASGSAAPTPVSS